MIQYICRSLEAVRRNSFIKSNKIKHNWAKCKQWMYISQEIKP